MRRHTYAQLILLALGTLNLALNLAFQSRLPCFNWPAFLLASLGVLMPGLFLFLERGR